MRFANRRQAGQELAVRLLEWVADGALADVVLALPRGGVPVAEEVARTLRVPLDVVVVRKIAVPGAPEVGIGAITGDDPPLFDTGALARLRLSEDDLRADVARERRELHRREVLYREGRPAPRVRGRGVVLVDDGLATGGTARAALRRLRRQEPARLTLAVPVSGPGTVEALRGEADDVLCLYRPRGFAAVGQYYADFEQVSDGDVVEALHRLRAGV